MTDRYRIANTVIEIKSLYPRVHRHCRAYLTTDLPVDISVETAPEDIVFEKERKKEADALLGAPVLCFSDDYYEMLAVYRRIAEKLPFRDIFLMHGSCIAVDGEAFLFTAKSGTGKSTHTRLWREMLKDRAVMVNDDKPLIGVSDSGATAYGTPWDGKHRLSADIAVPLKTICILERAERNRISEISFSEVYPMLAQQIYRPQQVDAMLKTLQLIDRLPAAVRFFRLCCNMDSEAARISYEAMRG